MSVKTADGKNWDEENVRLVGSVKKVRDRDINKPALVGQFPVFVEQEGSFRMFTYNKKITEVS
jgi:hypothetical protein